MKRNRQMSNGINERLKKTGECVVLNIYFNKAVLKRKKGVDERK